MKKATSSFGLRTEAELTDRYHSLIAERRDLNLLTTYQQTYSIPIHNWYKFTQAFSPNLVFHFINELEANQSSHILDPFAGVGTTPLACQQCGIRSTGFEISPLSSFIANAKLKTDFDWREMQQRALSLKKEEASYCRKKHDLPAAQEVDLTRFLPGESIKYILGVREWLSHESEDVRKFFMVALLDSFESMSYIRKHGSHYRFMNTENTGVQRQIEFDKIHPSKILHKRIESMINDLRYEQTTLEAGPKRHICNEVVNASIFDLENRNERDFTHIITSPPYLNRNNYIAQQKPEMMMFDLIPSFKEYRALTKRTLRSHVEASKQHSIEYSNRYIGQILEDISEENLSHPTIPEMILGYFEDLFATLKLIEERATDARRYCFIVGNSRWAGVVVPVDTIILTIAEDLNLTPKNIFVTRYKGNSPQQMAKYGKFPLRESIVIFGGER